MNPTATPRWSQALLATALAASTLAGTLFADCWMQFSTTCCKISKYAENPSPNGPGGLYCNGTWCPDVPVANPVVTDVTQGTPGKVDYQVQPRLACTWNESQCVGGACSAGTGPFHSAWCYPYTAVGAVCGGGGGGT